MDNLLHRLRKLKANSFTLVELLVVISIIGLLAGLATPAIQKGLEKGRQTVDVNNGRQLGLLLFAYANDEGLGGGTFPSGFGSSTELFQMLVTNNFLTTLKILGGNGIPAPISTNNINSTNIYWAYTTGLTITDGNVPLLSTRGALADVNSTNPISPSGNSPWKEKGFVVVTADNSSAWYSFTGGKVTPRWLPCTNSGVEVLQP